MEKDDYKYHQRLFQPTLSLAENNLCQRNEIAHGFMLSSIIVPIGVCLKIQYCGKQKICIIKTFTMKRTFKGRSLMCIMPIS